MVNYQLGKIYKIVDLDSNKCYVGSTCEPTLARRLTNHVSDYKQYLKGKGSYVSSFKILEMDDYDIVLLETYPCNSKDELHARERYYTLLLPQLNVHRLEYLEQLFPSPSNQAKVDDKHGTSKKIMVQHFLDVYVTE